MKNVIKIMFMTFIAFNIIAAAVNNARLQAYNTVANKLACLSNQQLTELLAERQWKSGWGKTGSLDIDGITVFMKKIPLTDLEQKSENLHATANIFDLPLFYQYKVGSAGFGAWREVAAHQITTHWVLTGKNQNFPLLYHWRILPENTIKSEQLNVKELEKTIQRWNNSAEVGERLIAMNKAKASIVVFLESIPETMDDFLIKKGKEGKHAFEKAVMMVDKNLQQTTSFMIDQGMIHFDAHSGNILADGKRLYFTDFGLALYKDFDLSPEEKEFFERHKNYDSYYTRADLTFLLCQALSLTEDQAIELLQSYIAGTQHKVIYSRYINSLLKKYAAGAMVVENFEKALRKQSKLTPYPAEELKRSFHENFQEQSIVNALMAGQKNKQSKK